MLELAVPILVVYHVTARLSKVYLYQPYHKPVSSRPSYMPVAHLDIQISRIHILDI
jgi:hypothetical protein